MDLNLLSEESYDRRFVVRRSEMEDGKGFGDLLNSQGGQALFRATFGMFLLSSFHFRCFIHLAELPLLFSPKLSVCFFFLSISTLPFLHFLRLLILATPHT